MLIAEGHRPDTCARPSEAELLFSRRVGKFPPPAGRGDEINSKRWKCDCQWRAKERGLPALKVIFYQRWARAQGEMEETSPHAGHKLSPWMNYTVGTVSGMFLLLGLLGNTTTIVLYLT